MQAITYKEASKLLNVGESNIRTAIYQGNLTQIAEKSAIKHIAKEQVELFKNKKQISLRSLSPEEMKLWEQYKHEALTLKVEPVNIKVEIDYKKLVYELLQQLASTNLPLPEESRIPPPSDENTKETVHL